MWEDGKEYEGQEDTERGKEEGADVSIGYLP